MARSAGDISLGRFTAQCAATGRVIHPGEPIVAALCDVPEDAPGGALGAGEAEGAGGETGGAGGMGQPFVRRDFCMEAWTQGARPEGLVCFWRTVAPAPDQKRRLLVDDETLLELFDRLEGDDRPQRVAYRWLLCLILLRKKLLRHVRVEREEDREWWLVRRRGAEDDLPPIRVANPHIRDEDLRELADHLGEVMQSEL